MSQNIKKIPLFTIAKTVKHAFQYLHSTKNISENLEVSSCYAIFLKKEINLM